MPNSECALMSEMRLITREYSNTYMKASLVELWNLSFTSFSYANFYADPLIPDHAELRLNSLWSKLKCTQEQTSFPVRTLPPHLLVNPSPQHRLATEINSQQLLVLKTRRCGLNKMAKCDDVLAPECVYQKSAQKNIILRLM